MICICKRVRKSIIINSITEGNMTTTEIKHNTEAGTKCGKCIPIIDDLIEEYKKRQL